MAYLSAGIGFCFMTQIGRYAQIIKQLILTAKALLDRDPHPSEATIAESIAGNMCRCTGYLPILRAIVAVAAEGNG